MRGRGDRRWLLLGAGGPVRGHLRLALAGRDVVETSHRAQLPGTVTVDLTDPAATTRLIREARPDVIVVAAANAFVEQCEREPIATRAINVDAVQRVADAAPDALLVVFSSEYVFDGSAGSYAEDDAVAPLNEYGRQKVAVEAIARGRPDHLVCRLLLEKKKYNSSLTSITVFLSKMWHGRLVCGLPNQVITD